MKRVVIVGTTGAGKTTLARRLADKQGSSFIELDALHWLENWTPNPNFASDVANVLEAECWVVDGNYNAQVQPPRSDPRSALERQYRDAHGAVFQPRLAVHLVFQDALETAAALSGTLCREAGAVS